MKTSATQYELLLSFMEQHGDLSKPSTKAKGKVQIIRKWEELTNILNSEGSGEPKTLEKWKKVWSDFKNNIKKKTARTNSAARRTGGGPALNVKLSDLEQRLISLIGKEAATGLDVVEAGLAQTINQSVAAISSPKHVQTSPVKLLLGSSCIKVTPPRASPIPQSSFIRTANLVTTSPSPVIVEEVGEDWALPGPSSRAHIFVPETEDQSSRQVVILNREATPFRALSPLFERAADTNAAPTPRGQTNTQRQSSPRQRQPTPRRRRIAPTSQVGSPIRRRPMMPMPNTDQAAQDFLQADAEWRAFEMLQHRDNMVRQREAERIRLLELDVQKNWQTVASKALDIIDKYFSK